jgi:PST family polysaccharide transporter
MFKKIRSKQHKNFIKNFFSLTVLQIINYALPLLVIPYLFSTLGADKFGLVIFAQSFVAYFGFVINYGFNLSAVREISLHRGDIKKVSEIYSVVTSIKCIFLIIAFLLLILAVVTFDVLYENWILYIFTFALLIESILFPFWFYQGMEKMKYITIIYSISKIIVTALIFIFIKSPDDYLVLPLLYFVGSMTTGIMSSFILFKTFKIKYSRPRVNEMRECLIDGWYLFVSNLTKNVYKNSNIFILGLVSNTVFVGYYALAEKVIKALQALMGPLSDTLYPYISKTSTEKGKTLNSIFKISKFYTAILIVIVSAVIFFAPLIAAIVSGGSDDIGSVVINIRILSAVILFGVLNDLFGIIGLINLGYKKYYMNSILLVAMINLSLCFYLANYLQDMGAAIALAISEFILIILLFSKLIYIKVIKKSFE